MRPCFSPSLVFLVGANSRQLVWVLKIGRATHLGPGIDIERLMWEEGEGELVG